MLMQLALRNLGRNRRRSLVTIFAIAAGFAAVNLFGGYVANVFGGLQNSAVYGEGLGHLTIAKQGYFSEGHMHKEDFVINADELDKLQTSILQYPQVKLVAPRFTLNGLISNGENSTIFIADALSAQDQETLRGDVVSDASSALSQEDNFAVVLGSDLANSLNLKQNDNAVLFTSTLSGQANAYDVVVNNVYNTGTAATNDKFVTLPLQLARDLLDNQGAEKLTVLLQDTAQTQAMREQLLTELNKAGFGVDIRTWDEQSAFYQQVRGMFSLIFLFIFSIVITIVVMNIINTMSMSVVERTREIGTLRSLGMQRTTVRRLFSLEGFLLALIGSVAGVVLSITVATLVSNANISYVPPGNSSPVPLLVNIVPALLVMALVVLTLLSTLFSLLPARRAAKAVITDALGHV